MLKKSSLFVKDIIFLLNLSPLKSIINQKLALWQLFTNPLKMRESHLSSFLNQMF